MGVLLFYPIAILCWFLPALLIFISPLTKGTQKTRWVLLCLLSFLVPGLVAICGWTLAELLGAHRGDLGKVQLSNVLAPIFPWAVYAIFYWRHRQTDAR